MRTIRILSILLIAAWLATGCGNKQNGAAEAAADEETFEMTDFTLPDLNGHEVNALETVRQNKLTLIDFWASWCGPCRAEMPNVIRIYEQYKAQGFGIIGVSLDSDEAAWRKAVEELGMTWPQLSDLKGWKNEAAVSYGISSIPYTLLVDDKGIILASNLRGTDLEQFVTKRLQGEETD